MSSLQPISLKGDQRFQNATDGIMQAADHLNFLYHTNHHHPHLELMFFPVSEFSKLTRRFGVMWI